jgi:hypothetical protein
MFVCARALGSRWAGRHLCFSKFQTGERSKKLVPYTLRATFAGGGIHDGSLSNTLSKLLITGLRPSCAAAVAAAAALFGGGALC